MTNKTHLEKLKERYIKENRMYDLIRLKEISWAILKDIEEMQEIDNYDYIKTKKMVKKLIKKGIK